MGEEGGRHRERTNTNKSNLLPFQKQNTAAVNYKTQTPLLRRSPICRYADDALPSLLSL